MVFRISDISILIGCLSLTMEINEFIQNLELEFQDIGQVELQPETVLKEISGWNSMHVLLLVAMIDVNYQVLLSGEQLKPIVTVQELFNLVKQQQGA